MKLQEDMQHAADASAFKQAGAVKTCAATWFCSVFLSNMQSTLAYLPHMNICVCIYIYIYISIYTIIDTHYTHSTFQDLPRNVDFMISSVRLTEM